MEREVVIALANSPGVLDFYVRIAWKSWVLKSARIRVSLFPPGGLEEQLGCQIMPRTVSSAAMLTSGCELSALTGLNVLPKSPPMARALSFGPQSPSLLFIRCK
jgi:hypothetical protein